MPKMGWQDSIPSRSPRGVSFFLPFPVSRGYPPSLAHGCITHISSDCESPAALFSLVGTLVITLDPPGQYRILFSRKTLNYTSKVPLAL